MMKLAAGIGLAIGGLVGGDGLAAELPAPFDTELGRKYRAELALVQVPASRLPPGCELARTTGSAPIFPATTNPQATEDRQLIGFVAALIGGRRKDRRLGLALRNRAGGFGSLWNDRVDRPAEARAIGAQGADGRAGLARQGRQRRGVRRDQRVYRPDSVDDAQPRCSKAAR